MSLSFFDPATGALRELRPAAPPRVGLDARDDSPRGIMLRDSLRRALSFLGLEAAAGSEIRIGGRDPGVRSAWLKVAPAVGRIATGEELRERGFRPEHFQFFCLKTHYRSPLQFSWEALAAARADYSQLCDSALALSGVTDEPSARGRAGYLHRFREAVSRDLDFPAALNCLRDALRPGALSPGSKAALLREALPALGLSA